MVSKVLVGVMLAGSLALAGCSSDAKDIKAVDTKVEVLKQDVDGLKLDVQEAKSEAARANQRLDNQVSTYRK